VEEWRRIGPPSDSRHRFAAATMSPLLKGKASFSVNLDQKSRKIFVFDQSG
jgi:hypothetical protein